MKQIKMIAKKMGIPVIVKYNRFAHDYQITGCFLRDAENLLTALMDYGYCRKMSATGFYIAK